ncbi:MAG: hypothetical protein ACYC6Y_20705 [Thermoguttaceae bacterium]
MGLERSFVEKESAAVTGGSAEASRSAPRPLRLFLLATLLPALVVALDEWAIVHGNRNDWNESSLAILYALYVVQVPALTGFVGHFVSTWFLRWTILLWVVMLVDLRLFTIASHHSTGCLAYAFLSSQLSLLVFIATLGPGRWPWRLPSAVVATVVVIYFLLGNRPWHELWSTILVLQTIVTFPLFMMLLLVGYRLRYRAAGRDGRANDASDLGFRFSVGHILFWMLAAVPVLTVGQHLNLAVFQILDVRTWVRLSLVAVCLSIVPLLVVMTVFSRRHLPWMIALTLLLTAGLGVVLAISLDAGWVPPPMASRTWQDWLFIELTEVGVWWIPWILLSAAFFASLLLLFRTGGYRLEHWRQTHWAAQGGRAG